VLATYLLLDQPLLTQ